MKKRFITIVLMFFLILPVLSLYTENINTDKDNVNFINTLIKPDCNLPPHVM